MKRLFISKFQKFISLVLLLLNINNNNFILFPSALPCAKVTTSHGISCLCNTKYCDTVPPLPSNLGSNQYVIYTSSKKGLRLDQTIGTFKNFEEQTFMTSTSSPRKIHINDKVLYQTIHGFGNAITDAALVNYYKMEPQIQELLLKQYWGADNEGTNFYIGRIPISSTDFSTHVYSYDDVNDDYDLEHFSIQVDHDIGKIDFIKKVQSLNPNISFFATSWAPPAWMTKQNTTIKNPSLRKDNNIPEIYSNYIVKFFEEYKKIGITFWGLTAQNEPAGNTGTWQDLKFSPEEERDFIKQCLGPALKKSNVTNNIKLMMLDDQRIHLPTWTKTILSDSDAAKYIDGIAVHWYAATEDITPSGLYFGFMNKTHTDYPSFFLLATEACEGFLPWSKGVELGSWTRGETYAHDIIGDINNWATGWTDWNAFLDLKGGPNWANNECDSPIILDTENTTQFYKQPMYYALAHFSSYVPKGSVRIDVQSESTSILKAPMECTGFKTPDGHIVLVVLNKGLVSSDAEYSITYGNKTISNLVAPANSLQTLIWNA